jgi:porphobilinogen synthase
MSFPKNRNRRLRSSDAIRSLVEENHLRLTDFIVPLFLIDGSGKKEEIDSMPGCYLFSLDLLVDEVRICYDLGLRSVLLFAKCEDDLKDNKGTEAINPNGLMQRGITAIKKEEPKIYLMSDVALDPYSRYGHDGIVDEGEIVNDKTIEILAEMALSHARAGVDMVAPSDMMDGRIGVIRDKLEENGFVNIGIMSYSAKYASSFYGPFRDALDSAPGFGNKKTYQMNVANSDEAINEVKMDIEEGADMIMVKPGMPYLDIVKRVSDSFKIPVVAYQVSGEYAMLKAAAEKGWLNHDEVMMESLIAFKRAGATLIASYFAKEVALLMRNTQFTDLNE